MKVKEHQYEDKDQAIQKSYAAVEEDCTSGLVIEVFDDSDKVGADVVLHGCPQSGMANPVAVSYTHLTLPTNAEV